MASIALYIFILLALAAIVIVISVILYNRRLDKITRGEEHDTHSRLPEPGATAGVTYKTVLMILLIVSVLSISALLGKINALQNTVSNQQSDLFHISSQLAVIDDRLAQNGKAVLTQAYEVLGSDLEGNKVEVKYWAKLKHFSDSTKVILSLNGRDIELTREQGGTFSATFAADMFESYIEPELQIVEGSITTVEDADFYGEVFWEYFPMLTYSCSFETKENMGKHKYSGWYQPELQNTAGLKKIQMTYVSDGKEIFTKDITKEALASERFELENDLPYGKDLIFRTEITTQDGFKIVENTLMIYEATPDYDQDDSIRIYDKNGNLVWENEESIYKKR